MITPPRPQLTVAELIELLKAEDPTMLVRIEGCDCEGAAAAVMQFDGAVVIARTDSDVWD